MDHIIVEFLASFLIYFLFLGLLILWVIDGKIKKEQVIHAMFACFFALVVAVVIKFLFPTLRPFMLNGNDTQVFIRPMDSAFPSEHTVVAFALAVTVFLHDRKVGFYFLLAALIIGYSRVLANIHFPVDILGGAFLGTISAVILDKIHFANLFKKGKLKIKHRVDF